MIPLPRPLLISDPLLGRGLGQKGSSDGRSPQTRAWGQQQPQRVLRAARRSQWATSSPSGPGAGLSAGARGLGCVPPPPTAPRPHGPEARRGPARGGELGARPQAAARGARFLSPPRLMQHRREVGCGGALRRRPRPPGGGLRVPSHVVRSCVIRARRPGGGTCAWTRPSHRGPLVRRQLPGLPCGLGPGDRDRRWLGRVAVGTHPCLLEECVRSRICSLLFRRGSDIDSFTGLQGSPREGVGPPALGTQRGHGRETVESGTPVQASVIQEGAKPLASPSPRVSGVYGNP